MPNGEHSFINGHTWTEHGEGQVMEHRGLLMSPDLTDY